MLKEIFLMRDGMLTYHFGRESQTTVSDEVILSSGLLSALTDFSKTARSDFLESFFTEREHFLFIRYPKTDNVLVGVFERDTPDSLALRGLKRIQDLIAAADLPEENAVIDLNTPEKRALSKELSEFTDRFFGREGEATYIEELLEKRTNISLAFLVDTDNKELIAKFARPRPLFRAQHATDFFLLNDTLSTTLSRLGIESYSYFNILSKEYVTSVVRSGSRCSVASGSLYTNKKEVVETALAMFHYSNLDELIGKKFKTNLVTQAILQFDGNFKQLLGEPLPVQFAITFLALINIVKGFFRLLTPRNFELFEIVCHSKEHNERIVISKQNDNENYNIELFSSR
ncbi:MAG: hypothetical protein ACFFE8_04070 [Candidatus Heimdallarchaeota archaeon]